ncbi:MAG: hypothetical protein ACREFB_17355 [Stellaceae bacterium]
MSKPAQRTQRDSERHYPVRVRIAVPPDGFGRQLAAMHAWLDATCGSAGWASAPAGLTGVVNDAVTFYFDDAALADAFVTRFCCGYRIAAPAASAFPLGAETPALPTARLGHKTPD